MKHHSTEFAAQCELANKDAQEHWKIDKTENGWFIVREKTKAEIIDELESIGIDTAAFLKHVHAIINTALLTNSPPPRVVSFKFKQIGGPNP